MQKDPKIEIPTEPYRFEWKEQLNGMSMKICQVKHLPKWERVKVYNDIIAGIEIKKYLPKYQAAKIEILEHLKKRVDDIVDGRC